MGSSSSRPRHENPPDYESPPRYENLTPSKPQITETEKHAVQLDFKYEGRENFTTVVRRMALRKTGPTVIEFSGVKPAEFRAIQSSANRPLQSIKFAYDSVTNVLRVSTHRRAHQYLVSWLYALIRHELQAKGIESEFSCLFSRLIELGNWAKEPDHVSGPMANLIPTMIIEAQSSDSAHYLEADAKRWLESPKTNVKWCITIEFDQAKKIVIDVWRGGVLPGASVPSAYREQHIELWNDERGGRIDGWRLDYATQKNLPTKNMRFDLAALIEWHDVEADIPLDQNRLLDFARRFWNGRHWQR